MTGRRSYPTFIMINNRIITEVIIDPHYEKKHADISDTLILKIIQTFNGLEVAAESRQGKWTYYRVEAFRFEGKRYRIVFCLQDSGSFIGIVNCHRR